MSIRRIFRKLKSSYVLYPVNSGDKTTNVNTKVVSM